MHAIGDRAIVVKGSKYFFYCMKNIVYTIDIKKCFLLAGKGGVSHILGGCRRANGDADPGRLGAELLVGGANGSVELRRERSARDPAADSCAAAPKRSDIVDIERRERLIDPVAEVVGVEEFVERKRGRREAAGDADP